MVLCLICKETVSIFKDYNLKRYYMEKNDDKFNGDHRTLCKNKTAELKKKTCHLNKIFFKKATTQRNSYCKKLVK